ncbi:hypothetical protein Tco_0299546 [Tanacetum coccineum]
MDDPNITMEEYIRLEEEKAQRHGRTFNWQTATYGKMEYCEDEDDSFTNLKTKYPAIVFDDTSDAALSCEPTVSRLNNNEIDFETSFDESDDEDYMVEGYNEDIVHNYEQRLETIWGRSVNRVHVLDFSGLTKGMRQTLGDRLRIVYIGDEGQELFTSHAWRRRLGLFLLALGLHTDEEMAKAGFGAYWLGNMAPLPSRDQRYPFLRYQVEEYDEGIVHSYEQRLETIWGRSVNRVHILDFVGLTEGMRQTLGDRLSMVYTRDEGQELFTSHAWRRLFEIRAPLVRGFILEFLSTYRMSDTEMGLDVADTFISVRGQAPEKLTDVDLFYLRSMDRGTSNVLYLLAQYLFRHAEGRKSGARLSGGHFIGHLDAHFGLRQPNATASAPRAVKDALAADEGAQGDPAPMYAPQPPPPAPRTIQQRVSRLEEEVQELRQSIDLAVRKSTIWYTLKKTYVEFVRSF